MAADASPIPARVPHPVWISRVSNDISKQGRAEG